MRARLGERVAGSGEQKKSCGSREGAPLRSAGGSSSELLWQIMQSKEAVSRALRRRGQLGDDRRIAVLRMAEPALGAARSPLSA